MLSAAPVKHASMLMFRSCNRLTPPETDVNAASRSGTQPITSKMSSGRSTRGSIAAVRLRRSTSDGGSGIAINFATCSRPSSSTVTSAFPVAARSPTSRKRQVQEQGMLGQQILRIFGQAEVGQRQVLGNLPGITLQQLSARIAPAGRGLGVDVAALEVAVELGEHAHHVGVLVDGAAARTGPEHQTLPRAGHQPGIDRSE